MDDITDKKTPRKSPGAPFFLVSMTFYLLVVHMTSLMTLPNSPSGGPTHAYPDTWTWLSTFLDRLAGDSATQCAWVALPILWGCMVCVFLLTRVLVPGPPWLGSLSGTFLMAHPAKTEVLFSPLGLYYLLATLTALAALLAYVHLRKYGGWKRYALATLLYSLAVFPFTLNATLFGLLLLVEFMCGEAEERNWLRLVPLLVLTMISNGLRIGTLYSGLPTPDSILSPLFLVLYPIGLLPETQNHLAASPGEAWLWGIFTVACMVVLFALVNSKPLRLSLLAILFFRLYPGALPIDLVTLDGAGQLLLPIALAGIGLAALSAWLMHFETWAQPTVSLTTILCFMLFILQFQANRNFVQSTDDAEITVTSKDVPRPPLHLNSGSRP